jgi:hypothetical protein
MPKLIEERIDSYKMATGKEAKIYTTPVTPGECLMKHLGEPVKIDEYRSLVGKIMYCTTKLAPERSNAKRIGISLIQSRRQTLDGIRKISGIPKTLLWSILKYGCINVLDNLLIIHILFSVYFSLALSTGSFSE